MYKVIKQKRKSMSINISEDLEVIIKVPYYATDKEIIEVTNRYSEWIDKAKKEKTRRMSYKDWIGKGELTYLGENKKIRLIESRNDKSCIKCIEGSFIIETPEVNNEQVIKSLMEAYWRKEAKKLFTELTELYCKKLDCQYEKITIRKQKTRWGSCSNKGNISYNIKLMGAPPQVIEYIVLHEVTHLLHFNHSNSFWRTIEEVMPEYKKHQEYLKTKGMYLGI